jgi:hypothetical protein
VQEDTFIHVALLAVHVVLEEEDLPYLQLVELDHVQDAAVDHPDPVFL